MSRKSVLLMRARCAVDSEIPLRSYFLWVGGALLALLLAANWLMPSSPAGESNRSEVEFPPIRIHSQLKGPERVVIDTN